MEAVERPVASSHRVLATSRGHVEVLKPVTSFAFSSTTHWHSFLRRDFPNSFSHFSFVKEKHVVNILELIEFSVVDVRSCVGMLGTGYALLLLHSLQAYTRCRWLEGSSLIMRVK